MSQVEEVACNVRHVCVSCEEKTGENFTTASTSGEEAEKSEIIEKLERIDSLVESWEEHGLELCDKQLQTFAAYVREAEKSFKNGPVAKAELVVQYLESTQLGQKVSDLALGEKLAWAVTYLETSLEESRLAVSVQQALSKAKGRLLEYDELPGPWQENPCIRKGYRFLPGYTGCVRSIFTIHNETANIWAHVLGIVLFLYLSFYDLPQTEPWKLGTWFDRAPMIIFMLAAMKCLFCSILWHSFNAIARLKTKRCMACVDYTGISVCICASIVTTEYSVLNCHPKAQMFYIVITLACGAFGIVLNWHPVFDTTGARTLRAMFFSFFAIFGSLAGFHACIYRGVADTFAYYVPVLKSLLCYGTGILFYASLFPERYFDGFDICGASHQIWHGFVVAGVYYHYKAMIEIFGHAVKEACHASVYQH